MASDLSDSEEDECYATTNVMLGYASKEPTDDPFNQLGGVPVCFIAVPHPILLNASADNQRQTWLDNQPPSASFARCKTCHSMMVLLLQLNGDLPEYFPGHERRLYLFACKRKPCRRKPGTIRALRCTKTSTSPVHIPSSSTPASTQADAPKQPQPPINLGDSIFAPSSSNQAAGKLNSFSTSTKPPTNPNPFSSTKAAYPSPHSHQTNHATSLPVQPNAQGQPPDPSTLSQTFAQKARISSPPSPPQQPESSPRLPWPSRSSLPLPYPSYYLDADYETLDFPPPNNPSNLTSTTTPLPVTNDPNEEAEDDPSSWLSSSSTSKTFLRFAARLAQNPEQVLRYEFRGEPLLYSKSDDVGRAFPSYSSSSSSASSSSTTTTTAKVRPTVAAQPSNSNIKNNINNNKLPPCSNCGGKRVFEFQLTPHAISALEEEEGEAMMEEGMEWGTVVVGVC
ncbi:MAG: hypothetical protein Q9197_004716, partial [Variospora fuerteventurae]